MEATVKKQDQDGDGTNAVKIGSGSKRNGDTNNKMTRPRAKLKFGLDKTRLPLVSGKGNDYHRAIKTREEWLIHNDWNSVTTDTRKLPANVKYMVVDVETHDWKEGTDVRDGRIVEIAWGLFSDEGNCLESKQYLLKPHGYKEIARKATAVHGITTECAISHGSDANLVFDEFTSVLKAIPRHGFVIAYNMFHEDQIFMCNLTQEQTIVWNNAPKCDTYPMVLWKYLPPQASKKYMKQTRRDHGMNLTELHNIIQTERKSCNKFAHTAIADVEMTWDIFRYYSKPDRASHNELKWIRKQNRANVGVGGGRRPKLGLVGEPRQQRD